MAKMNDEEVRNAEFSERGILTGFTGLGVDWGQARTDRDEKDHKDGKDGGLASAVGEARWTPGGLKGGQGKLRKIKN
ncbi:MAG: hypothetical protein JWR19_1235 [Pedosphaera sp.]|jgi:hypothetical protein|nr:hypothetical protein [Pedosphaera sp.]